MLGHAWGRVRLRCLLGHGPVPLLGGVLEVDKLPVEQLLDNIVGRLLATCLQKTIRFKNFAAGPLVRRIGHDHFQLGTRLLGCGRRHRVLSPRLLLLLVALRSLGLGWHVLWQRIVLAA